MQKREIRALLNRIDIRTDSLDEMLFIPTKYVMESICLEGILVIKLFKRKNIILNEGKPDILIFIKDEDYLSLKLVEGEYKWRTAALEHMICVWDSANKGDIIYSHYIEDRERVNQYLGQDINTEPVNAIRTFQRQICEKRYKEKIKKVTDKYEQDMQCIPEIPADLNKFVDEVVLAESRYLIYKRDKKKINAFCTYCRQNVTVEYAAHGKKGICPHCQTMATYKAAGRIKTLYDQQDTALMQQVDFEGEKRLLVRYFHITRDFRFGRYKNPETAVRENRREFWNLDGSEYKAYSYSTFRQRNVIWNDENDICAPTVAWVYPDNVSEILKMTAWKYSAIDIMAIKKYPVALAGFLKNYKRYPGLEYLVKIGLYNLANDAAYYEESLHLNEKRIRDVLGIGMEYLPQLKRINVTMHQFEMIKESICKGVRLSDDQVRWISKYKEWHQDLYNVCQYTSIYKSIKYLDQYVRKYKHAIDDWLDYLNMCKALGYDMKNSFVLFPKNLKAAHDEAAALLKYRKNQKLERKYKKLVNSYTKYEMQSDGLMIQVPRTLMDIVAEGKALHHCVGTYIEKVGEARTLILFIREINAPDKSFYTMEVRENKVIQVRGYSNRDMTAAVKRLVAKFKKDKLTVVKKSA